MTLSGTDRGSGARNTGGESTYAITPASNFGANALAILCLSYDNSAAGGTDPYNGVTDTKGNTWTAYAAGRNSPGGAANDGICLRIVASKLSSALTTSDTITVDFGGTTTVARAYTLTEVSSTVAGTWVPGDASTSSATTATPSLAHGVVGGDFTIDCVAREANGTRTGDADTTNGSWSTAVSAGVGATTSGAEVISQYKVPNATGTQTYDPTFGGASADGVSGYLEVGFTPAPPQTPIRDPFGMSGFFGG